MATTKIRGNAAGSGSVTITAPNTNSNRTLTLPDADVTIPNEIPSADAGYSKNVLTTQGDTLYASGANTLARLAKGTAGQTLKMNSGATAPEWVTVAEPTQDFKKLATVNVAGSASVLTMNGYFTADYDTYYIVGHGYPSSNSHLSTRVLRSGSAVSASEYVYSGWRSYNDTSNNNQLSDSSVQTGDFDNPNDTINAEADAVEAAATHTSTMQMWLHRPLSTTEWKRFKVEFHFLCSSNTNVHTRYGFVKNTAALSGVQFTWSSSANMTGKFTMYGLTV